MFLRFIYLVEFCFIIAQALEKAFFFHTHRQRVKEREREKERVRCRQRDTQRERVTKRQIRRETWETEMTYFTRS